jgi:hypothetical protein
MVHIISIILPCVILIKLFLLESKRITVLANTYKTNIHIIHNKNMISWCKSTIPSAIGVAGS